MCSCHITDCDISKSWDHISSNEYNIAWRGDVTCTGHKTLWSTTRGIAKVTSGKIRGIRAGLLNDVQVVYVTACLTISLKKSTYFIPCVLIKVWKSKIQLFLGISPLLYALDMLTNSYIKIDSAFHPSTDRQDTDQHLILHWGADIYCWKSLACSRAAIWEIWFSNETRAITYIPYTQSQKKCTVDSCVSFGEVCS